MSFQEVIFNDLCTTLNDFFTCYALLPALLCLGIYLTIRLKGVQFSKLWMGFSYLFRRADKGGKGEISHYQAVSSVLAGNLGTGNISGMAVALVTGGPGALVWMWVMAFLGAAIQYASCLLGVKYRRYNDRGELVGGPMYYLREGMGQRIFALLFAVCAIFASFTVGNFVQINSMMLPLQEVGVAPWALGVVVAFFTALVILGGAKQIAKVSAAVVPFMALLYLGVALFIVGRHSGQIVPALQMIWSAAFSPSALAGGAVGFTLMQALTTGFHRAIFATDTGTGLVPILQANAKTSHPVIDGVVALVAPLIVMVVCTTTALLLMVTGAYTHETLHSTNMVVYAFQKGVGGWLGTGVVTLSLMLFGYTTNLSWACCLERAVGFLCGSRWIRPFQWGYIFVVPVGAFLQVDAVWVLADGALSLMVVLNLIGVCGLSREVIRDSQQFFASVTRGVTGMAHIEEERGAL